MPASLIVQEHQSQRHEPPSQKRRWPDNAPIESKREPQPSHLNFPVSGHFDGADLAPPRNLPPQAAQSVAGPFGPGALPDVSSLLQPHQSHDHFPPSQNLLCPDNAPIESNKLPQPSHLNLPVSGHLEGADLAPPRNRPPQAAHKVAGPFGPGARPDVSSRLQPHQSQLHLPPSQKRRWPDSAEFVGNFASQESHKKFPSASRFGGPVAPCL